MFANVSEIEMPQLICSALNSYRYSVVAIHMINVNLNENNKREELCPPQTASVE